MADADTKRVSGLGATCWGPGLDKVKYGEGKISGVELSISWLVVRLTA
jgi:hypothetical protein